MISSCLQEPLPHDSAIIFLPHSHTVLHRNCVVPEHRHDTVMLVNAVYISKCLATSGELCIVQLVLFESARTTYSACATSAKLHHGQLL